MVVHQKPVTLVEARVDTRIDRVCGQTWVSFSSFNVSLRPIVPEEDGMNRFRVCPPEAPIPRGSKTRFFSRRSEMVTGPPRVRGHMSSCWYPSGVRACGRGCAFLLGVSIETAPSCAPHFTKSTFEECRGKKGDEGERRGP